jgi:hypothetical protein
LDDVDCNAAHPANKQALESPYDADTVDNLDNSTVDVEHLIGDFILGAGLQHAAPPSLVDKLEVNLADTEVVAVDLGCGKCTRFANKQYGKDWEAH